RPAASPSSLTGATRPSSRAAASRWRRASPRSSTFPPRWVRLLPMSDFKPPDAFVSPRFGQIATFMRLPHRKDVGAFEVALLGIPFDGGTSYRTGARFGPREIRAQSAMIRPYSHPQRVSPFEPLQIADYGDIDVVPS